MVADYEAQLDRELGQVIGRTETELDTRGPVVRRGEATFGNLLADALIAATGADIAITNGGGIRGGRVYPPGSELTPRMLISELPFGKATVVLALTGAQLREALENSVSRAEENDGRFPQVAGVRFAFDTRRPPGSRITRIEIGGAGVGGAEVGGVEVGGVEVGGVEVGGVEVGGVEVGGAGVGGGRGRRGRGRRGRDGRGRGRRSRAGPGRGGGRRRATPYRWTRRGPTLSRPTTSCTRAATDIRCSSARRS